MRDVDERIRALLVDETSVPSRRMPTGTPGRVARRHVTNIGAVVAGLVGGIALVVAVLGPIGGDPTPSVSPASRSTTDYVSPAWWPTVRYQASEEIAAAVLETVVVRGDASSDEQVLAMGTVDDLPFGIVGHHESRRGNEGWGECGTLVVGGTPATDGEVGLAGGQCSEGWFVRVPAERDMLATTTFEAAPLNGFETFFGIVSDRVASVHVTMDDGTVVDVPVIPGPDGWSINYVAFFAPFGEAGRVEARGPDGMVIDRATVCVPQDVIDSRGSGSESCTGTRAALEH